MSKPTETGKDLDMPALMISEIRVKSPEKLAEYMEKTQALARTFGAEMVARAEFARHLTGSDDHDRVVVARFPDMDRLEAWFTSDAYAALVPLREAASDMRMTAYSIPG